MTELLQIIAAAAIGCAAGSLMACVPALHIYNVMGLAMAGVYTLGPGASEIPECILVPLTVGLLAGWSMANTIPSVLLAAPDESVLLTVLPGQKYAMMGRGFDAVMLTAFGSLAAAFLLVFAVGPLAPIFMPTFHSVFRRHSHWILWAVIVFMVMSEWPRLGNRGQGGWRRFVRAWAPLCAGLLTFTLAGLLGFILHYRSPIHAGAAFQNMMPAFAGLFAVPWLVLNIAGRVKLPPQRTEFKAGVPPQVGLRGLCAGFMGGAFAAYFPGISGGIGGMLAGHASSQRDSRMFLVSQGASKFVYYVGAFLLFFVPGESHARGTATWLLRGIYVPHGWHDYYVALASLAISAAMGFMLLPPLTRMVVRLIELAGYVRISVASLCVVLALVWTMTGLPGILVMLVASGIGLLPALFHSRRINCLGIILLPMACSMSGIGAGVAWTLGLIQA